MSRSVAGGAVMPSSVGETGVARKLAVAKARRPIVHKIRWWTVTSHFPD